MARYFTIMQGLRGCYMPDSCNVIKVDTRRELRNAIAWEANDIRDAGFVGLTKRDPAWAAALLWRKASKQAILPYGHKRDNLAFAIDISVATRAEYLENLECD
jgi:hypothetical protein